MAQVEGSGIAVDSILWLKPVIEPSARRTKAALSDIENGASASNGEMRLPENRSGSVRAWPETLSSNVPGVPGAPCPSSVSAKNVSVELGAPTLLLKVRLALLLMALMGAAKPVSEAVSVIVSGAAVRFSMFDVDNWSSSGLPNWLWVNASWTKGAPNALIDDQEIVGAARLVAGQLPIEASEGCPRPRQSRFAAARPRGSPSTRGAPPLVLVFS